MNYKVFCEMKNMNKLERWLEAARGAKRHKKPKVHRIRFQGWMIGIDMMSNHHDEAGWKPTEGMRYP